MGQAKLRGSFEQRKQERLRFEEAESQKRVEAQAVTDSMLTPEGRLSQERAAQARRHRRLVLSQLIGFAAYAGIARP